MRQRSGSSAIPQAMKRSDLLVHRSMGKILPYGPRKPMASPSSRLASE